MCVSLCTQFYSQVFYNTARYYRAYYGHKMDPRAVLVGLVLVLSAFQYLNQLTNIRQYNHAQKGSCYKIDYELWKLSGIEECLMRRGFTIKWTRKKRKISAKNLICR